MFESDILIKSSHTLIVNLAVAFIALYFALVKFRVEKWWDKEFQCYMEVMELLNEIIKISDETIQFNNGESSLVKADLRKLFVDFGVCKMRLGGISTVGKLLLADEALASVMKYDSHLYRFDIGRADAHSVTVFREEAQEFLDDFALLAKRDLKKNSFLRRF